MNSGGRFSDGFLLGALIGGACVFLLGTDKGKKLLKVISQEGEGALTTFLEDFEEEHKEKKTEAKPQKVVSESTPAEFNFEEEKEHKDHQKEKPVKRFFKRSK